MKRLWIAFIYCLSQVLWAHDLYQATMLHPQFGPYIVTYENQHGYAVTEGDILLGRTKDLSLGAMLTRLEARQWPHGVVPYELDEKLPRANAYAVRDAIELWEQKAGIIFIRLNERNRSLYPDYVAFVPVDGKTCASYVGRHGGRQEVELSTRCKLMTTVHEIGHVLGLWHEQSRSDRDLYVKVLWENIEEGHEYNFFQHLSNNGDYGDYDYDSIMHYSPYAFSKNGEKTIIPLKADVLIGQREHISLGDIAAVKAMYPSDDENKEARDDK